MDWPVRFLAEMSAGTISVRSYHPADAAELFGALADERVWEHMSRGSRPMPPHWTRSSGPGSQTVTW